LAVGPRDGRDGVGQQGRLYVRGTTPKPSASVSARPWVSNRTRLSFVARIPRFAPLASVREPSHSFHVIQEKDFQLLIFRQKQYCGEVWLEATNREEGNRSEKGCCK